eukprot:SAG31_NODE_1467_length_8227_cov_7.040108_11_plen_154_part_00
MLRALSAQLVPPTTTAKAAAATRHVESRPLAPPQGTEGSATVNCSAGRHPASYRRACRKFVVAQMSHETNTFSPVATDLARFAGGLPGSGAVPPQGPAVIEANRGQQTGLGAFIQLVEDAGDEVGLCALDFLLLDMRTMLPAHVHQLCIAFAC